MKRNLIGILSLVVMSLMFTATGAYAQSYAKAECTLRFQVGSAQLPAGTYEVRARAKPEHDLIRNGDSRRPHCRSPGASILGIRPPSWCSTGR